jgi:hypothetical protein
MYYVYILHVYIIITLIILYWKIMFTQYFLKLCFYFVLGIIFYQNEAIHAKDSYLTIF